MSELINEMQTKLKELAGVKADLGKIRGFIAVNFCQFPGQVRSPYIKIWEQEEFDKLDTVDVVFRAFYEVAEISAQRKIEEDAKNRKRKDPRA